LSSYWFSTSTIWYMWRLSYFIVKPWYCKILKWSLCSSNTRKFVSCQNSALSRGFMFCSKIMFASDMVVAEFTALFAIRKSCTSGYILLQLLMAVTPVHLHLIHVYPVNWSWLMSHDSVICASPPRQFTVQLSEEYRTHFMLWMSSKTEGLFELILGVVKVLSNIELFALWN